jgi:hypothetical protein
MKSKEEKQEILNKEIALTKLNASNEKLNSFQKNPQVAGAIYLTIAAIISIAFGMPLLWWVLLIFGARRLLRAKKIGENKKFITLGYFIVYATFFMILILGTAIFVINEVATNLELNS